MRTYRNYRVVGTCKDYLQVGIVLYLWYNIGKIEGHGLISFSKS